MIPSIEQICEDLAAGQITVQQAIEWLYIHAQDGGANLRDAFATAALQGLLAYPDSEMQVEMEAHYKGHAERAYGYADAMLAERAKA